VRSRFHDKHKNKEIKKESNGSTMSHKKKGEKKKKKMKKVVYYETDSLAPSTLDAGLASSKSNERKKSNKIPSRYPCIPKSTQLLLVPLGKPPQFDGDDYAMWSDKMRHHLTSLHKSIWDIVEFGAQVHRLERKTMIQTRSPKSNISTLKPPPYSMLLCVRKSITWCKD
jgi:hypothetical protein